jgi:hypothetical protein
MSTLVRLSTDCDATVRNWVNTEKTPSNRVLFGYLVNYVQLLFYWLRNSYHLIADYYLNSLQNKLSILLENIPFRTFCFVSGEKQQNPSFTAMNAVFAVENQKSDLPSHQTSFSLTFSSVDIGERWVIKSNRRKEVHSCGGSRILLLAYGTLRAYERQ